MTKFTDYLDTRFYPQFGDRWDDQLFREMLLATIEPTHRCLDYGAGRGRVSQMDLSGVAEFVAGVDPDPGVFENPFLSEAKQLDLRDNVIPYPDDSFDIVFSDNVMEHIEEPKVVLAEICRVLKPGGMLLFKTPNKWHYMPLIARFTPTSFHKYYNRLRGRDSVDTFPTQYRLNTSGDVEACSHYAGLQVREIQLIEGRPEYLRLFSITYIMGIMYERAVNAFELFRRFRCVLIARLQKPAPD